MIRDYFHIVYQNEPILFMDTSDIIRTLQAGVNTTRGSTNEQVQHIK